MLRIIWHIILFTLPGRLWASTCAQQTVTLEAGTTSKYLSLDGYPSTVYANNLNCNWLIKSEKDGAKVYVDVLESDIEYYADCKFDYLVIYDGGGKTSTKVGKYCGFDIPFVKGTGDEIFIHFHSDGQLQKKGFKIEYYIYDFSEAIRILGISLGILISLCSIFILCCLCKGKKRCKNCFQKCQSRAQRNRIISVVPLRPHPDRQGDTFTRHSSFQMSRRRRHQEVSNRTVSHPPQDVPPCYIPDDPGSINYQPAIEVDPECPPSSPPPAYHEDLDEEETDILRNSPNET